MLKLKLGILLLVLKMSNIHENQSSLVVNVHGHLRR